MGFLKYNLLEVFILCIFVFISRIPGKSCGVRQGSVLFFRMET